jgi:hypothetical protein
MRLLPLLLLPALLGAQPAALKPQEISQGWIMLFDGETLFGWTPVGGAEWKVQDGAIVSSGDANGWLSTNVPFKDYRLRCDFKIPQPLTNTGLFLRSARAGDPAVTGYELNIYQGKHEYPTGGLVKTAKPKPVADLKPGVWHTFEVTVDGSRFIVVLDGEQLLDATDTKSASGFIGLQYNKNNPAEFRNIYLQPLGTTPVFDGKTLDGWKPVPAPQATQPAEWSVQKGAIHVEKGPGGLETAKTWDDFALQLEVRTNTPDPNRHPNSGVFVRGDPGVLWSGYEAQIRNEYENGDRTRPVDFGTGAIYRNQPTRKVVTNDNEWFTMTIIASGRRLSVWLDGYPVTSWEDPKPEGMNVRKGEARLKAGTLNLQAHDPTTNLDFRNIRIAPMSTEGKVAQ